MQQSHYLRSDLLTRAGFVHAFFTREGGISQGAFASLNASPDTGDRPEHVTENLRRISHLLGVPTAHLYVPRQVHGRGVLVLDRQQAASTVANTAADAVVASEAGLACAVRTADCVPILLADRESGRVAAVHAGWRGIVQGIVQASIELMIQLGSQPAAIVAAIGPHISGAVFEVGGDVASQLALASDAEGAVQQVSATKARVDLGQILGAQLLTAGLGGENIERLASCTYRDPARFFSYRRDGQQSGRMLSAIVSRAQTLTHGGHSEPHARAQDGAP